jgi:hypothetical protein
MGGDNMPGSGNQSVDMEDRAQQKEMQDERRRRLEDKADHEYESGVDGSVLTIIEDMND